jgi:hypothetical protein
MHSIGQIKLLTNHYPGTADTATDTQSKQLISMVFLRRFPDSSTNPNIRDCVYERMLLPQFNVVHTITGNYLMRSILILSHSPLLCLLTGDPPSGFVVKFTSLCYSFYIKMEQHVTPKCWYLSTKLHGVISKKTVIVTVIAVETWHIINLSCFKGKVFLTEY